MPDTRSRPESRPVVVVTGASAGVGRAVAEAYGRRGARVALLARGPERLGSACRAVEAAGGEALACPVDVADAAAVSAAADLVVRTWGRIDVWVNNAMATILSPAEEITPEEFRRVTEVTYLGQVHGTLAALRHMRPRDRGAIVQVGSALAYRSIPLQSAYCAAKAAVRGFTDSLRSELIHGGSGVRLTMVQLPAVNTPQFDWARNRIPGTPAPVPPIFQPEPVAEAILRAADEAPRELWIGGTAVQAILGTFAAPGFLDHLMARRAWDSQMERSGTGADGRSGNLFSPPPGDPGAHGRFDERARSSVHAVSETTARVGVAVLGALILAGAAWAGRASAGPARRREARGAPVLRYGGGPVRAAPGRSFPPRV